MLKAWAELLEAWLALTSVKYHDNPLILMLFKQLLALTMLRTTGPWMLYLVDRLRWKTKKRFAFHIVLHGLWLLLVFVLFFWFRWGRGE